MPGFGLPNFGQITEAFKKAQQIQQEAQKLQLELDGMEIEGLSEGGHVTISLSGNQQPLKVEIDPQLLSLGKVACEEEVLSALINAYELSTTTMKNKMEALPGGLNLPGINDVD